MEKFFEWIWEKEISEQLSKFRESANILINEPKLFKWKIIRLIVWEHSGFLYKFWRLFWNIATLSNANLWFRWRLFNAGKPIVIENSFGKKIETKTMLGEFDLSKWLLDNVKDLWKNKDFEVTKVYDDILKIASKESETRSIIENIEKWIKKIPKSLSDIRVVLESTNIESFNKVELESLNKTVDKLIELWKTGIERSEYKAEIIGAIKDFLKSPESAVDSLEWLIKEIPEINKIDKSLLTNSFSSLEGKVDIKILDILKLWWADLEPIKLIQSNQKILFVWEGTNMAFNSKISGHILESKVIVKINEIYTTQKIDYLDWVVDKYNETKNLIKKIKDTSEKTRLESELLKVWKNLNLTSIESVYEEVELKITEEADAKIEAKEKAEAKAETKAEEARLKNASDIAKEKNKGKWGYKKQKKSTEKTETKERWPTAKQKETLRLSEQLEELNLREKINKLLDNSNSRMSAIDKKYIDISDFSNNDGLKRAIGENEKKIPSIESLLVDSRFENILKNSWVDISDLTKEYEGRNLKYSISWIEKSRIEKIIDLIKKAGKKAIKK